MAPVSCAINWDAPPPLKSPIPTSPLTPQSPITIVPQNQAIPWTETAPIASSILSFFSMNSIEKTTIIPPIKPAITAPGAEKKYSLILINLGFLVY